MNSKLGVMLAFLLIAVFCLTIISSWGWSGGPRLYVWIISFSGLVLISTFVAQQLVQMRKAGPEVASQRRKLLDSTDPASKVGRPEIIFFSWMFGLLAMTWLLGFEVSALLFTFLYLKLKASQSWKMSLTLTAATGILLLGILGRFFHLAWPDAAIRTWLGF